MYHSRSNAQVVQYIRTLTAMLHWDVNHNQQDRSGHPCTITYAYNSYVYRSTNTLPTV